MYTLYILWTWFEKFWSFNEGKKGYNLFITAWRIASFCFAAKGKSYFLTEKEEGSKKTICVFCVRRVAKIWRKSKKTGKWSRFPFIKPLTFLAMILSPRLVWESWSKTIIPHVFSFWNSTGRERQKSKKDSLQGEHKITFRCTRPRREISYGQPETATKWIASCWKTDLACLRGAWT